MTAIFSMVALTLAYTLFFLALRVAMTTRTAMQTVSRASTVVVPIVTPIIIIIWKGMSKVAGPCAMSGVPTTIRVRREFLTSGSV